MKHISISKLHYAKMMEHVLEGRKIAAIKHLRAHGKMHPTPDPSPSSLSGSTNGIGLREAKHALEHAMGQELSPCCTIIPPLRIKSVIIESEDGGTMELDLDELQLKLLDGLGTIPMSYMASSLELMQFLRNWETFEKEV